nr:hypothetical protein [uncultured Acetobacterium sp.]
MIVDIKETYPVQHFDVFVKIGFVENGPTETSSDRVALIFEDYKTLENNKNDKKMKIWVCKFP